MQVTAAQVIASYQRRNVGRAGDRCAGLAARGGMLGDCTPEGGHNSTGMPVL